MAETTTGWRPIAEAPKGRDASGRLPMVLLIARYPTSPTGVWTDIRHGWWDDHLEGWERWPHSFPPSHFMASSTPVDAPLDLSTAVEG